MAIVLFLWTIWKYNIDLKMVRKWQWHLILHQQLNTSEAVATTHIMKNFGNPHTLIVTKNSTSKKKTLRNNSKNKLCCLSYTLLSVTDVPQRMCHAHCSWLMYRKALLASIFIIIFSCLLLLLLHWSSVTVYNCMLSLKWFRYITKSS